MEILCVKLTDKIVISTISSFIGSSNKEWYSVNEISLNNLLRPLRVCRKNGHHTFMLEYYDDAANYLFFKGRSQKTLKKHFKTVIEELEKIIEKKKMKKFEGFIIKLTDKCIITRRKKVGAHEYKLYFNGNIHLDILIRKKVDKVDFLFMYILDKFYYKEACNKKEVSQIFMEFVQKVEKVSCFQLNCPTK